MEHGWLVADPSDLRWQAWEGTYSIYNRASGETHLLNELPAEILRRLSAGPTDSPSLALAIAEDLGLENTREWQSKIDTILASLFELGLIESTQG